MTHNYPAQKTNEAKQQMTISKQHYNKCMPHAQTLPACNDLPRCRPAYFRTMYFRTMPPCPMYVVMHPHVLCVPPRAPSPPFLQVLRTGGRTAPRTRQLPTNAPEPRKYALI